MTPYTSLGYLSVKMKVGGQAVDVDAARVHAVRDAVGSSVDIVLDANAAYDLPGAIEAARAFEP